MHEGAEGVISLLFGLLLFDIKSYSLVGIDRPGKREANPGELHWNLPEHVCTPLPVTRVSTELL